MKKLMVVAVAALAGVACLTASGATGLVDGVLTVEAGESYTLTDALTVTKFEVGANATVDLAGHDLTVGDGMTGVFWPTATGETRATITNSAAGEPALMKFLLTQGVGSEEFRKVKFAGNLKLWINASFSSVNFMNGIENDHTGGTVLDNLRGGADPRIQNGRPFGTGAVTFTNGMKLRDIAAAHTYEWTVLNVTGAEPVNFYMERANGLQSGTKVNIDAGTLFNVRDLKDGLGNWSEADLSGVYGTLAFFGYNNRASAFEANLPNGTLALTGIELRSGADASQGNWVVGSLASPVEVTASDETAKLRRVGTTGGRVTIEVGGANRDDTWYGQIVYDGNNAKDWNVLKVGTGTWTIGGVNYYHGTTEIRDGAIRLLKDGELGDSGTRPAINLTGGALYLPPDLGHGVIDRLRTPTAGVAAKLGVNDGDVLRITDSLANLTQGLTKVGPGALVLGENAVNYGGTLTLADGTFKAEKAIPGNIAFAGGTLVYAEDDTTDYSGKIVGSTGPIAIDTNGKVLIWKGNALATNNPDMTGFVKTGEGVLKLDSYNDGTLAVLADAKNTVRIDGGTLALLNCRKNAAKQLQAKVLGTGTLRIDPFETTGGWRITANGALEDFEGTFDYASDKEQTTAIGFLNKEKNLDLSKLRFSFTGAPAADTQIVKNEVNAGKTLTFGALDVLSEHAQLFFNNQINIVIAGGHGDSFLNGQFTNGAIAFTKNGTETLTIGTGFKTVDGSSLAVNAGALVVAAGATLPKLVVGEAAVVKVDVSGWVDYMEAKVLFTTTADATLGTVELVGAPAGYTTEVTLGEDGKVVCTAMPQGLAWTGAAGDGLWTTAGNWQGGAVPTAEDDILFTGDAAVAWSSEMAYTEIGTLYVNGTLTLKMTTFGSNGADRGLHVKGIEGAEGAKIVLQGARLSTVEGRSFTCAVPLEFADNAAKDENWVTGLAGYWTQTGAFSGEGTVRIRGWKPGASVYLDNDSTDFEGTLILDPDGSNFSYFRGAKSLGPKMTVVYEGMVKSHRILPVDEAFEDGKLTMKLGAIRQTKYFDVGFRVNLSNWDKNLLLEIGGNDQDSLIMGQWGDGPNASNWQRPSANCKIRKVGAGVMQVYKPSIRQGWELNGGVVEAIGPEALDGYIQDKAVSPISFGGGTLRYGVDTTSDAEHPTPVTTDWSDYIRGSTDAIRVDVEKKRSVVTWETALAASNEKHEIVKTGKGELILTAAPLWEGPTTVAMGDNAGSLYLPASVEYVLTDAKHTKVTPKTIEGVTYNEFHQPRWFAVIFK